MSVSGYKADSNIVARFFDHLVLGTQKNVPKETRDGAKKNILEKIGDVGMWGVEELPRILWTKAKDPRVVTVAITAIALFGLTFGFYATATLTAVKVAIALLPQVPFWAAKFALYVSLVEVTVAMAVRAEGRFCNKDLMNNFYGTKV